MSGGMVARCHHGGVTRLVEDIADVPRKLPREAQALVRQAGHVGNTIARDHARETAGSHGKHYPRSFSQQVDRPKWIFGELGIYATEYGPDASKPQGNMEFERGSRNQPPHGDLAYSARTMGPAVGRETREMVGRLLWH